MADSDIVTVSCTPETFHTWAHSEIAACAAEPFVTRAKRMKGLSTVLGKVSKALDARDVPAVLTFTIETALAPMAGYGMTVMPGITTPADQMSAGFKTPSELSKSYQDIADSLTAKVEEILNPTTEAAPPAVETAAAPPGTEATPTVAPAWSF